jgi:hypothetical protein
MTIVSVKRLTLNRALMPNARAERAEAEAAGLRDMVITYAPEVAATPPCVFCGYNGPGFYQPDTHPCMVRYHEIRAARAGGEQ